MCRFSFARCCCGGAVVCVDSQPSSDAKALICRRVARSLTASAIACAGPTVEDFVEVKPSTNPSLSSTRDDGTVWVSISCGSFV